MTEKDFSVRLSELRKLSGVSARDMSFSIGQNPGYINNIESGKALPSLSGFLYICEYLKVSPSEFFDVSTPNPSQINSIVNDLKCLEQSELDVIYLLIRILLRK